VLPQKRSVSSVAQSAAREHTSPDPRPWACSRAGQNWHFDPLEIGTKNQKFLENLKPAA